MSAVRRALRQFTFGAGKTAGRNSSGRITSFHRGGGAKRLQRTVDVKRTAASSMGVVERIEYDPNRSSRIALVRWLHGVHPDPPRRRIAAVDTSAPPPRRVLELNPTTAATNIRGLFAFNSLLPPGNLNRGTTPKDVFFSAFSPKAKGGAASATESVSAIESLSLGLPRIAVAGAKLAFFAPRVSGEDTFRVRNWRRHSTVWAHRIKRKAAVSWHSKTL